VNLQANRPCDAMTRADGRQRQTAPWETDDWRCSPPPRLPTLPELRATCWCCVRVLRAACCLGHAYEHSSITSSHADVNCLTACLPTYLACLACLCICTRKVPGAAPYTPLAFQESLTRLPGALASQSLCTVDHPSRRPKRIRSRVDR
jgi:hypothetical protein